MLNQVGEIGEEMLLRTFFEAWMEILKMHKQSPTMTRAHFGESARFGGTCLAQVENLGALYLIDKRIFRSCSAKCEPVPACQA